MGYENKCKYIGKVGVGYRTTCFSDLLCMNLGTKLSIKNI